jgi:hypothetical protein
VKQEVYECSYVLWWLAAVVGAAIAALVAGFPHSLVFVPSVTGWLFAWTAIGFGIDRRAQGRFAEGAYPFRLYPAAVSAWSLLGLCGLAYAGSAIYSNQTFAIQITLALSCVWLAIGYALHRALLQGSR